MLKSIGVRYALIIAGLLALSACTPPGPPPVITKPDWLKKPTANEFDRFYPADAQAAGVSGRAVLRCTVAAQGNLAGCSVQQEWPRGGGFGEAALKLVPYFQMKPATVDGQAKAGIVNIPLRFSAVGSPAPAPLDGKTPWRVGDVAKVITTGPKSASAKGEKFACGAKAPPGYECRVHGFTWAARPTDAATKTLLAAIPATDGVAMLICTAGVNGALAPCKVASGDKLAPPKVRDALVAYATGFRLPKMSEDGTATAGGAVVVTAPWKILRAAQEPTPQ